MAGFSSRFRRSIGNKFFRLNFTKTGVGVSAGVPGFRKSWHSSGRRTTTVGLPGSGLSWQKVERSKSGLRPTQRLPNPAPPPGWYPDPTGRFTERWWSGSAWTSRARRGSVQMRDPV